MKIKDTNQMETGYICGYGIVSTKLLQTNFFMRADFYDLF